MSNLELVLNMLNETATTEISQKKFPIHFRKTKILQSVAEMLPALPDEKLKRNLGSVVSKKNYLKSPNIKNYHDIHLSHASE